MAYIIGAECVGELDGSCVDVCPVDCIYEGEEKRYINPEECIECGACLEECPVSAIRGPKDLPDPVWVKDNADFFYTTLPGRSEPLGDPGGAMGTGPIGADTPLALSVKAGQ
ncbi:indolepyruvate ferredoxin oxidoreductase subunit alpha [Arthrobacter sp. SD76]|uniref:indolepyruvate ferredoxin oxidoreductase subunit alpha n=1 Tax=Arthrobacter sp. SD76 TaxID=3415007 RepID=UPI003C785455